MSETFLIRENIKVLVCESEGAALSTEQDALDLIGDAFGHDAKVIAVPATRLDPQFFALSSGIAGAFTQKFVNYRLILVILGDIAVYLEQSSALRAFVGEANQGNQVWFLQRIEDLDPLLAKLPKNQL